MNLEHLFPVISQVLGRDVRPDFELFYRSRAAVGGALNAEGQAFFVTHWRKIADFLETPDGQKAAQSFMESWHAHLYPAPKQPEAQQPSPAQAAPAPTASPSAAAEPAKDHQSGGRRR